MYDSMSIKDKLLDLANASHTSDVGTVDDSNFGVEDDEEIFASSAVEVHPLDPGVPSLKDKFREMLGKSASPTESSPNEESIRTEPVDLKDVADQTLEMCQAAVDRDKFQIEYAKYQTEEMCLAAVTRSGCLLQYAKFKTPRVCEAAIKCNPMAITYIDNPTEDLQLLAVRLDPSTIVHIKHPTYRVKVTAVSLSPELFKHFYKDADASLWIAAICVPKITSPYHYGDMPMSVFQKMPKQLQPEVWRQMQTWAKKIRDRDTAWLAAVESGEVLSETSWRQSDSLNWPDVKNFSQHVQQTPEICEAAVANRYSNFISVMRKTPAMCKDVLKYYGEMLFAVQDKTKDICAIAIESCPTAIRYVENPDQDLQLRAVELDPITIYLINNPCSQAISLAEKLTGGKVRIELSEGPADSSEDISSKTSLFGG